MSSTTTATTTEDKPKNVGFRVGLGDITPNNLGQLKRLNTVLFPVVYAPGFYKDVLEVGEFAKISTFRSPFGAEAVGKQNMRTGKTKSGLSDAGGHYIVRMDVDETVQETLTECSWRKVVCGNG